jgi:hypothetical protein
MTYTVTLIKSKIKLKTTYANGWLVCVEIVKNREKGAHKWGHIMQVLPHREDELQHYIDNLAGRVTYEKALTAEGAKKSQSLYSKFTHAWFMFYFDLTGFEPKFTATDGKALKEIAAYLLSQSNSEQEALSTWTYILKNWSKLDKFTQSKTELTYINSKLNSILIAFKNEQLTGKTKAKSDADDLRRGI